MDIMGFMEPTALAFLLTGTSANEKQNLLVNIS
jgi:hypothetical protein